MVSVGVPPFPDISSFSFRRVLLCTSSNFTLNPQIRILKHTLPCFDGHVVGTRRLLPGVVSCGSVSKQSGPQGEYFAGRRMILEFV